MMLKVNAGIYLWNLVAMTQKAAQRVQLCGRWQECFRRRRGCGDRGSLFSLGFRFVLFDAARRGACKDCTHLRVGQPSNRLGQVFGSGGVTAIQLDACFTFQAG